MTQSEGSNRLKGEQSQYLKQHQDNPVHWWPFGSEALEQAKKLKRPVFLSIGYSSCHWCHVMAHESFEDQATADFLNQNFVCIKVDREEHPDLDQYFQMACQAMSGHGGWPLSAFTTSDLKPFYVGTYFPKQSPRAEIPSFMQVLESLASTYKDNHQQVLQNAEQLSQAVLTPPQVDQKIEFQGHFPSPEAIINAIDGYADKEFGGYGGEPKFPHFAFYEWAVEQILEGMVRENFGKHIILSIEKMLMGGIFDHARGGIHRYSVDKKWMVPHFEKMLYDQAGLLRLLSKVSLIYPSPLIFDSIIQTLDYLRNEMMSEKGFFFAAQDADSEGMEGLFFTFTKDEFLDAIKDFEESLMDHQEKLLNWFQISDKGNFERGLNVISLNPAMKEEYYQPENWDKVRKVKHALLEARRNRVPPATDNKGIASWNFMLASALIDVAQYCKIETIAVQARELLKLCVPSIHNVFIQHDQQLNKSHLVHTTSKDIHLPLLENYVNYAEAQLRFYEVSGNEDFKLNGLQTLDYIFRDFVKDGQVFTRALSYQQNDQYPNLHTNLFDQSYKSSLASLILLVRKWSCAADLSAYQQQLAPIVEKFTQLALQNPIGHGEGLRALCYPEIAFKKIEVPHQWLLEGKMAEFMANFSTRFVLVYHNREDQSWQICNSRECEMQGKTLDEFRAVFKGQNAEA